jgi:hypothetical protein
MVEVFSFDWAKILLDDLASEITKYQTNKTKGQPNSFFMSSYIMDSIYFMTPFPLMS